MIEQLSALARETSSDRRRELLHAVTDLFLNNAAAPSREQGDLFGDIVRRVLEDVTVEARAELSNRVATVDVLPHDIAMRLATDDISVAEPMLRQSPVLSETDLISIAEDRGQEHLLAISVRDGLTSGVTDVLVRRGNTDVLRSVSTNESARFSQDGFRRLVDRAAADEVLRESLQRRRDLPAVEQQRLHDTMMEVIKVGIGDIADADRIAELTHGALTRIEQEMKVARSQRLEARFLSKDIKDGRITLSKAVSLLAESERQYDLAQILADLEGIAHTQIFRVLIAPEVSGLAVLAKSHSITPDAFAALVEMRRKRLKLTTEQARAEFNAYEQVDAQNAQRVMRFLKVRQSVGGLK